MNDGPRPRSSIRFGASEAIRIYGSPGLLVNAAPLSSPFARCVVRPGEGRTITLSSRHFVRYGNFEDRSDVFHPFVRALIARVAARNPDTVFRAGMPAALWLLWAVALVGMAVVTPLLVVVMIIGIVGDNPPVVVMLAVVYLAVVILSLVRYGRILWRSRSRRFDPRAVREVPS